MGGPILTVVMNTTKKTSRVTPILDFSRFKGEPARLGKLIKTAYAWKELPQPQLLTALGLSKVKPRRSRPS
jgi:hypothetical protein